MASLRDLIQEFPQKYFCDMGHGEATPQLHAGPLEAEMRKGRLLRCALWSSSTLALRDTDQVEGKSRINQEEMGKLLD
jgi:hypothetical protein